jgi:predicted transcriptional regulator
LKAIDLAIPLENLKWTYSDSTVGDVVKLMMQGGFSQIPVKDRKKDIFTGVVTDQGILKSMINPASERGIVSLDDLREMSVTPIVEAITDCPQNVSINIVAQLLTYFPALLLRDDSGNVKGIITRADMLKLLCAQN